MSVIEQICMLGVEDAALCKDNPSAFVGGQFIPYNPRDLASILTQIRQNPPKSYLVIEGVTNSGANFLKDALSIERVVHAASPDEKKMRMNLRCIKEPFDLISVDARSTGLSGDDIWRYIVGGKEERAKEFGAGAPLDYGIPKLNRGGFIIINRMGESANKIWFGLREKYLRMYQSNFVGLVNCRDSL